MNFTKNSSSDTIRLDRIWLKLRPAKRLSEILESHQSDNAKSFITGAFQAATDADGYIDLFLPLSGEFPTGVFFNNSYGSAAPELSMQSRAMLQFAGMATSRGAAGLKNIFGEPGDAAAAPMATLGNVLTQFSGGLTGPSIWERSEIPNIELSGEVGFENLAECNYFKAVDFVIQLMTSPKIGSGTPIPKLVELVTGAIKDGTPLSSLQVNALIQPNTLCEISIYGGRPIFEAGDVQTITDIVPSNELTNEVMISVPQLLLFYVENAFLATAKVACGKDGKAFDASGIPRMMTFAFTFTPQNIKTLIDGQMMVQDNYKPKDLQRIPAFNMTASDGMRSALFSLLNVGTLIAAKETQVARAVNAAGVGRRLTASNGKSYKNGVADWGVIRFTAEQSGVGPLARLIF